jgi:hypothetical protein
MLKVYMLSLAMVMGMTSVALAKMQTPEDTVGGTSGGGGSFAPSSFANQHSAFEKKEATPIATSSPAATLPSGQQRIDAAPVVTSSPAATLSAQQHITAAPVVSSSPAQTLPTQQRITATPVATSSPTGSFPSSSFQKTATPVISTSPATKLPTEPKISTPIVPHGPVQMPITPKIGAPPVTTSGPTTTTAPVKSNFGTITSFDREKGNLQPASGGGTAINNDPISPHGASTPPSAER